MAVPAQKPRFMKKRMFRLLKEAGTRLMVGQCVIAQVAIGFAAASPGSGGAGAGPQDAPRQLDEPAAAPVKVNRTVPKVEPPKTGLEFAATPTTQELFRARIFEEPLVPVGGEPTVAENADLAAALLGYSKRSGPDDFSSLTGTSG